MAKELQVKEFSALPVADDGKTLLYIDGEVKQSSKNLSEMLTDKVNNKLDTTAFSTVSGSFLTAHQVIPSGKWENVSDVVIANSATWENETDWADDINAASAYAYEQAVAQIPDQFDPTFLSGEIDKKLDAAIYEADCGKFLTAHQSLEGYLTKSSGDEYYQPKGNYVTNTQLEITSGKIVSQIPSIDGLATETFVQNVSGEITALIPTNYVTSGNYISGDLQYALTSGGWSKITGGVGGAGGAYVPLSAVECTIGSGNSSETGSFAQGKNNSASQYSLAQGIGNSASQNSLAQGSTNLSYYQSVCFGSNNSAYTNSFILGYHNYSDTNSFVLGSYTSAAYNSVAIGNRLNAMGYSFNFGDSNTAKYNSQTFGYGLKATSCASAAGYENAEIIYGSFVIGEFNKTSAAPFVIGNGKSDNDRRDLFVVDKDGNVSAQGQIYAEGCVLGASLDTLELAPDNETIEFVTSSHNVVNGEGDPEEYTVIKIKTSLLNDINKINELYNLVSKNSGTSNWVLPQKK